MFDRNTPQWQMATILFIEGIGVGNVSQPTLIGAQAHSSKEDRAVVTSLRNFLRSLGGSIGLVLSSAIFSNSLEKSLKSGIIPLPSGYVDNVLASILSVPNLATLNPTQIEEVLDAYMGASKDVFYTWAPCMALCLVLCILIKDKGLQRKEEKDLASGCVTPGATIHGDSHDETRAGRSLEDIEKGRGDHIRLSKNDKWFLAKLAAGSIRIEDSFLEQILASNNSIASFVRT